MTNTLSCVYIVVREERGAMVGTHNAKDRSPLLDLGVVHSEVSPLIAMLRPLGFGLIGIEDLVHGVVAEAVVLGVGLVCPRRNEHRRHCTYRGREQRDVTSHTHRVSH